MPHWEQRWELRVKNLTRALSPGSVPLVWPLLLLPPTSMVLPRGQRPVRVGTDCSGWESILLGLQTLGVAYEHLFSSDINPKVREVIKHNHGPTTIYSDCTRRSVSSMPAVDLYHAGFPCQPFSSAGRNGGLDDARGTVIYSILKYIRAKLPKLVLLENVQGLVQRHREVLDMIIACLTKAGYRVDWRLLRAHEHGLPHHRIRVFIVGLLTTRVDRVSICWPEPLPTPSLESILSPWCKSDNPKRLPPPSQRLARKHVRKFHKDMASRKLDLRKSKTVLDIGGTKLHSMYNMCPCLTRTRAGTGGHWVVSRGRRLRTVEMERLMGLRLRPPHPKGRVASLKRPDSVSQRQWLQILGNSIPVPMIARVLSKVLPQAGLTDHLTDVWAC